MNKKLYAVKGSIVLVAMTLLGTTMIAVTNLEAVFAPTSFRAPTAITGDNIYVAWWTNNTANGNEEVNFRASNDGGQTFGDKINLSNTSNSDSSNVEIESDVDSLVVSWWETNQTSTTPVTRVSNDNGATFGPVLRLAPNGTIGNSEDEEDEEDD
jgi:hypothetical protein